MRCFRKSKTDHDSAHDIVCRTENMWYRRTACFNFQRSLSFEPRVKSRYHARNLAPGDRTDGRLRSRRMNSWIFLGLSSCGGVVRYFFWELLCMT